MPGCNTLWGASGPKPGCSSQSTVSLTGFTGTQGPSVAAAADQRAMVLPTTAGWQNIGCIRDSSSMLLNTNQYYDTQVSVATCTNSCAQSGFNFAAIGQYQSKWVSQGRSRRSLYETDHST